MTTADTVLSGLVGAIVAAMVTCGIGVLIRKDEIRKSDLATRLVNLKAVVEYLLTSQNIMNNCFLRFANMDKSNRKNIEELVISSSALHSEAVAARKSALATATFLGEEQLAEAIVKLSEEMEPVVSQIMQFLGGKLAGHGDENEKWEEATHEFRVTNETVQGSCKKYESSVDDLVANVLAGMREINKNRNNTDIFDYLHRP